MSKLQFLAGGVSTLISRYIKCLRNCFQIWYKLHLTPEEICNCIILLLIIVETERKRGQGCWKGSMCVQFSRYRFSKFLNLLWLTTPLFPSLWPSPSSLRLLLSDSGEGTPAILWQVKVYFPTFFVDFRASSFFFYATSVPPPAPVSPAHAIVKPDIMSNKTSLPSNPHLIWWYANGLIITWQQSAGPFFSQDIGSKKKGCQPSSMLQKWH